MVALPWTRGAGSAATGDRSARARAVLLVLVAFVALASLASLGTGAAGVSLPEILGKWLSGQELSLREHVVLFDIRLPRLLTGLLVGASLAVSGAVMQGLFRNPLADPGIVGVGAGAGLGAVLAIVLGAFLPPAILAVAGMHLVALAAF
ncbi:MAG: iron chelate uptake ABC transporter family permease subunit, partial [Roseinatronobacter sp.]|nr:iron chelate uptake ABC transporter family permease subunit [Roseinatronobacter sp.]